VQKSRFKGGGGAPLFGGGPGERQLRHKLKRTTVLPFAKGGVTQEAQLTVELIGRKRKGSSLSSAEKRKLSVPSFKLAKGRGIFLARMAEQRPSWPEKGKETPLGPCGGKEIFTPPATREKDAYRLRPYARGEEEEIV